MVDNSRRRSRIGKEASRHGLSIEQFRQYLRIKFILQSGGVDREAQHSLAMQILRGMR